MAKLSLRLICLVCVFCALAVIGYPADTFKSLASFNFTDGSNTLAPVVQGLDGNFYGTTFQGGANCGGRMENCPGTVFRMSPNGTLATLHRFCSQPNCIDGYNPSAGLIQATDGNFYSTTNSRGAYGYGTVFRMSSRGTLTTLYSFCSQPNCTDGANPNAALVHATNGNFYGTTSFGGAYGDGTVFKITRAGELTTLYSFCSQPSCTDGTRPNTALVQATNGNFYGTTTSGGTNNWGSIFEITPAGKLTTLYSFCSQTNCTDGTLPDGNLIQAANGNFYGTAAGGGANGGGTIFEITPRGKLTTLYNFCSQPGCTDGYGPGAGLVQATNGNFYGTTESGGKNGADSVGTVFELTSGGSFATLYRFCPQLGCTDGSEPAADLIQATNGSFYGTTYDGGTDGDGSVFRLSVGLGPFVETLPTSGKVGAAVKILGNNLTGATSVTFNGTPATFTVVSSTGITATVPSGATTGKVVVATPSATLTSNVNFRVW